MKSDLFHVPIAILLIVSGCFCSSSLGLFPSGLMIYFFTVTFGFLSFCFLCICCRFVVTIGSYILTYNNDVCVSIYIYTDIYIYKFTSLHVKLLQSCLTLYNHVDYSPPGFSVHGILHAETLEWVAMPSSRGSS